MQTIDDYVAQEIFGADLGESFVEVNDDRLFDSQNAQGFDFLIERLQERRRRFRMQDGSRMGLEREHSWQGSDRVRTFNDRLHNELMAQMKAVEHAESEHSWAGNFSVVGTVEKSQILRMSGWMLRQSFPVTRG